MAGMQHDDPGCDWVDDDEPSADETMRRFAALSLVQVELPTAGTGSVLVTIASTNQGTGPSTTVVESLWSTVSDRNQLVS